MQVALVFPPLTDPRGPQLAIPSLCAALRGANIDVSVHDTNLRGIVDLCAPRRLLELRDELLRGHESRPSAELGRAIETAERLVDDAPAALQILRSAAFYEPLAFAGARRIVDEVLRVASLATAGGSVDAGLSPIRYDVRGTDASSLRDLIDATGRPGHDLFQRTNDALLDELARTRPLLVGISITNRQQIIPGLTLARRLRAAGRFVVIGGAVFSKFRGELLSRPDFFRVFADAVVVYEGETALLALIDALANGTGLRAVPNLLYLEGDAVVGTTIHVEDVPSLRTPDFSGLSLSDYLAPAPVLPILMGKGCYFNRCKFCDIPHINHISRKPYRIRRPEQVIADLHALQAAHAVSHFVVTDEALSPRLLLDLADAFDARPGHFCLTGYARPEPGFSTEVCRRIATLGFRKLFFGVESGSQVTLDHMDKAIRIAQVPQVLENCRSAGIDFHLFGIVGSPEETAVEARKTLAFLIDNKATIDSPGSSFDVHPFGLELRTEYFLNGPKYGIRLHANAMRRDFAIGVEAGDWHNTRGLSPVQARELIDTEMTPALRDTFRDWHATPDPLWPPQEEYSVLYHSRFAGQRFGWKSRLPADDTTPFGFALDRFAVGPVVDGGVEIRRLDLSARIPVPLARMLASDERLGLAAHAATWPGGPPIDEVRTYIESLIALGVVAIRCGDPDGP